MKKETIGEKNRRIIQEVWDGKHSSEDFCDTCKSNGEDSDYLRHCHKYDFASYAMRITNCIGYEEKEEN